ncbi:hypothetical protein [Nocardioides jejuensis]|uniref:DUF4352 domain-containing protein n=1 Tax=Nocardioides jejuensis TaxID=2502782 RepID=A0A4V2NZ86_9ACTN|nr:hypothetical protein [Nocardioides jejuensis]TCJ28032.1 hypothetical protein EPD65_08575 [Nocardioides jejuensis]
MTSRGHRRFLAGSAAVLALSLGLTGCGGDAKKAAKPTAKPTVTAGVTLTPSGERLAIGAAANLVWAPDQNTKGIVSVAVTKIVQGSQADIARIRITPKPEDPHLYYVTVAVENLGKVDLGGVPASRLPLFLDEGTDLLNPPADLRADMKFDKCPRGVLPKKFAQGAKATVCLVYVPTSSVQRMILQPATGDVISWPGDVTTPSPSPSATKKKAGAKPTRKPAPKASASKG